MKKLLPLVLLFIGVGAGVGAGIFLRPEPSAEMAQGDISGSAEEEYKEEDTQEDAKNGDDGEVSKEELTHEFVKLNNQFVVPIVQEEKVTALVVLALSIEVPAGSTDSVYLREPKLRDSFLQVLFDHANMGGFEGNFTSAKMLNQLRGALLEVAKRDLGKDLAKDVLIIEIARQDY